VLLSLDIAKRTGWGLCEPSPRPSIRLGSWQLGDGVIQDRCHVLARKIIATIRSEGVTYAIIETPQSGVGEREVIEETKLGFERKRKLFGSIGTQTQLWALHGAAVAILGAMKVPYRTVSPATWRKGVFGNGRMPGTEAKRKSRELLEGMGVVVPNYDAAEAGALAIFANAHLRHWQAEDEIRPAA
jgi:hypothetical protein